MAENNQRRGTTPTWRAIAYAVAIFALGALAFYVLPGLLTGNPNTHEVAMDRDTQQQEAYNKYDPARMNELKFPNGTLVPQGAPVTLDKDRLAAVATSPNEDIIIWSTPEYAQGGGGGSVQAQNRALQNHTKILPQALGKLYVELPDGRFQPMVERMPHDK
jgi:hypothetical protein